MSSMLFSKRVQILLALYESQIRFGKTAVTSHILEEKCGLNYQRLHTLADYWEEAGIVKALPIRGGHSEYKLTTQGLSLAARYQQRKRIVQIGSSMILILSLGIILSMVFL